jgi:hypothetical protein
MYLLRTSTGICILKYDFCMGVFSTMETVNAEDMGLSVTSPCCPSMRGGGASTCIFRGLASNSSLTGFSKVPGANATAGSTGAVCPKGMGCSASLRTTVLSRSLITISFDDWYAGSWLDDDDDDDDDELEEDLDEELELEDECDDELDDEDDEDDDELDDDELEHEELEDEELDDDDEDGGFLGSKEQMAFCSLVHSCAK